MKTILYKILAFLGNLIGKPFYTESSRKYADKDISARSNHWRTIRKHHLEHQPRCQWCNGIEELEVHHIAPFHLHPEDELLDENLITLCEKRGLDCHFKHGHNGTSWKDFNPNVRDDCKKHHY